ATESPITHEFYVLPVEKRATASAESNVYTGPGENYYAVSEGLAISSGQDIGFYGKVSDWAMVSVPVDGGNTVGYVRLSSAPADLSLKNLNFDKEAFKLYSTAVLMDAPGNKGALKLQVPAGTEVTVLAEIKELGLVYVEIPSGVDGKPVRGFIPRDALGV
ncbi:MAG: hypothetical protein Q4E07_03070, partial [Eubacteriales bacterium]|nr:hypothetical protein [Eubacteriales bacterium]